MDVHLLAKVMVLFAVADLLTSVIADKDLIINEVVYNSFV